MYQEAAAIYERSQKSKKKLCVVTAVDVERTKNDTSVINECAVPLFNTPPDIELPECRNPKLMEILQALVRTVPGVTTVSQHYIPTTGNPVKVPPWCIPVHY